MASRLSPRAWARRIDPLRLAAAAAAFAVVGLLAATRTPPPARATVPVAQAPDMRLAEAAWTVECPAPSGRLVPAPDHAGRTGTPGCRFHPADPGGGQDGICGVTVSLLIPECGAWWGLYTKPPDGTANWAGGVTNIENRVHRQFDLVYRFHWWDATVPDDDERRLAANGHYLRINLRTQDAGGRQLRWAAIAAGAQDATIDRHAREIAALRSPVFLSVDQEPETDAGTEGTAADFAAAWRRIHDRFAAARNVIWVWTVTGYAGHRDLDGELYPGDRYVDWVSWDAYDFGGCHLSPPQSFADTVGPFYRWLIKHGYGTKPFMLSEFGSTDQADSRAWFAGIPAALQRLPNIRALIMFNSEFPARPDAPVRSLADLCDTRVTASPTTLAAFAGAGHDPYLNHPLRRWR